MSYRRYIVCLLIPLAVLWAALAIAPNDRHDWLLENVLLFAAVAFLAATYKVFPLSRVSYTLIFVFLCLHTVGAHYTYAQVPYDAWFEGLTGRSFNSLVGWSATTSIGSFTSVTVCCSLTRFASCSCGWRTCAGSGATSCLWT